MICTVYGLEFQRLGYKVSGVIEYKRDFTTPDTSKNNLLQSI